MNISSKSDKEKLEDALSLSNLAGEFIQDVMLADLESEEEPYEQLLEIYGNFCTAENNIRKYVRLNFED